MKSETKSMRSGLLAAGIVGALCAAGAPALAQGGFAAGVAPYEAMDTLSGAGTGGPGAGYVALDRARGAAGGDPFASPTGDPFAAPGGDPFAGGATPYGAAPYGATPYGAAPAATPYGAGPAAGAAFFDPAVAGAYAGEDIGFAGFAPGFAPGAPGAAPYQPPQIPKVTAIYGDRVVCRVTGQMLEDAYEVPIYQTFSGQYYDDGINGLDYQANDNKFTNVRLVEDYMSPEAHMVKSRLIQGLEVLESMKPNEFALVPVASTDPLAGVPKMLELEEERDEKLLTWARRFLQDFRANPEEEETGNWVFYRTHMPPPPFPPFINVPANFFPPFEEIPPSPEELQQQQQQRQGGREGGFGDSGVGNAAYF